jgi:PIN domain nuclease of toxin-antitoxin system
MIRNRRRAGRPPYEFSISTQLEGFHRDPADQLIVATSRVLGMPVVTADQRIIRFGEVEPIW